LHLYLNTIGFFVFLLTLLLFFIFVSKLIILFFKRNHFPKKTLTAFVAGLVLFFGLFIYIQYFFTFRTIDKKLMQKGPESVSSPSGKYTANAYYEPYGGAGPSSGVNVWIEISNNENHTIKTIYYAAAKSQFSMEWLDEVKLSIVNHESKYTNSNRSIELNVDKEIYHENGLACQSLLMKDEYVTCYQHESTSYN